MASTNNNTVPPPTHTNTAAPTDKVLKQEARSFLGRRDAYPRRSASYEPTLEELKSKSFSEYVRGILFRPEPEEAEVQVAVSSSTTEHTTAAAEEPSPEADIHHSQRIQNSNSTYKLPPSSSDKQPQQHHTTFINKHRRWNDGIVKVTLPTDFWDQSGIGKDTSGRGVAWQPGTKLGDLVVNQPIKQVVRGIGGVYEYTLLDLPSMTLSEFREKADAYRDKQVGKTMTKDNNNNNSYSDDECDLLARKFWKRLGPTMDSAVYGADMEGSLFQGEQACGWNLEHLESCLQLLCVDTDGQNLPGVTTPYLYIGMFGSVFAAHTEDMNLLSINYLHAGAPKYWYAIAPEDAKRFESLAESHFCHAFRECREFLRHKQYLLSPAILKRAGVPFTTQIQRPGDAIITMPGGYHFGINLGFNVAEATNFAVPEWIPKGHEANICLCRPYSVHIDMARFESLLKRYEEDTTNAENLGFRKLSYREWTLLEASRRKQNGGQGSGSKSGKTTACDPNLENAKKGVDFWIEVTKPLTSEASAPKKKRQKHSKEPKSDDWRLAKPIMSQRVLQMGTKVLCLLPGRDKNDAQLAEDQCFAGKVIELDEGCVKVHFEGMQRKDDAWVDVNQDRIFLDSGLQYYK